MDECMKAFIEWRIESGSGDPMTKSGDFISPQAKYEFQLWTDAWLSASNAVLAGRIAELTRENSELKAARDALAAQLTDLRMAIAANYEFEITQGKPSKLAQQHLAEIRAEAGADYHAAKVRKGEQI